MRYFASSLLLARRPVRRLRRNCLSIPGLRFSRRRRVWLLLSRLDHRRSDRSDLFRFPRIRCVRHATLLNARFSLRSERSRQPHLLERGCRRSRFVFAGVRFSLRRCPQFRLRPLRWSRCLLGSLWFSFASDDHLLRAHLSSDSQAAKECGRKPFQHQTPDKQSGAIRKRVITSYQTCDYTMKPRTSNISNPSPSTIR